MPSAEAETSPKLMKGRTLNVGKTVKNRLSIEFETEAGAQARGHLGSITSNKNNQAVLFGPSQ